MSNPLDSIACDFRSTIYVARGAPLTEPARELLDAIGRGDASEVIRLGRNLQPKVEVSQYDVSAVLALAVLVPGAATWVRWSRGGEGWVWGADVPDGAALAPMSPDAQPRVCRAVLKCLVEYADDRAVAQGCRPDGRGVQEARERETARIVSCLNANVVESR